MGNFVGTLSLHLHEPKMMKEAQAAQARFRCQFGVGEAGLAHSGIWRVWSAKNRADLFCMSLSVGGEIKASVHSPRPPDQPDWRRHWGFGHDAKGEIAQSAIAAGGRHKILPPGCKLAPDCTLEWRIIFRGSALCETPFDADEGTVLLPIPGDGEQLEVDVIIGPRGPTTGHPREQGTPTHLLSQGRLIDNRRVWIVYTVKPIVGAWGVIVGKGHAAAGFENETRELRGVAYGVEPDGSLKFIEGRVARLKGGRPCIRWTRDG